MKFITLFLFIFVPAACLPACRVYELLSSEAKEKTGSREQSEKSDKDETVILTGDKTNLPGGVQVSTDGKNVWPPKGPGCDRLVKCCSSASKQNSTIGLTCQLSVAKEPVNCKEALETVRNVIEELGGDPPKECSP